MVFCRQCGAAYYRVKLTSDDSGTGLMPREDRREEDDDGSHDAYLYLSEAAPWPRGDGAALLERLPAFMKEPTAAGTDRIRPDLRGDVPEAVFVDPAGRLVSEGQGSPAALIRKNFLFCLEPSCGVAYTKSQRSERSKLATLGVDNRSTATTILAVRSLIELQSDRDLKPEARKLLSFTDNRQDASLQAGHFNDFAQVALLRSALHKATTERGPAGLGHGELSRGVFDAMDLKFFEYAADPDVKGPAIAATKDAFRRVIDYYLYRDLQRGWRVTAPNLEDCGLLTFDYVGLKGDDSLLAETGVWETGFSVRVDRNNEEFIETPALPSPVSSRDPRRGHPHTARRLAPVPRGQGGRTRPTEAARPGRADEAAPAGRHGLVSRRGRRAGQVDRGLSPPETAAGSHGAVRVVLRRLRSVREANAEQFRSARTAVRPAGSGRRHSFPPPRPQALRHRRTGPQRRHPGLSDQCRCAAVAARAPAMCVPWTGRAYSHAGEEPPAANRYFVECYRRFVDLKCVLEAREHTAQVDAEDREEREERFRTAELPLLFCSPTMELGVDIAQLNLVNLRNVPPTPANYAQRSGRAGRGGQPALVYTYCAGRSPHDQYYFREPNQMVAGVVAPPRVDIRNRDLVRSHLHAVWMEVAKPDLGKTLKTVLDLDPVENKFPLPVKDALTQEFKNPVFRAAALAKANQLVASVRDELATAAWFHEGWTGEALDQIGRAFDDSCDRWRSLFRAAKRQRELHHRIIGDHSRPDEERSHSRRLRAQAESQIRLLTEAAGLYEGDFYSYRYFAAEGFLPGYNFPRLPISAYIPGRRQRKGRDEMVSRPRFLAISEFGPRALIYHEGARYRVYQVNLDFGSDDIEATHELVTATMKRCSACGYAHLEQGNNLAEVCDGCGSSLDGPAKIESLVHMQNVSLKLAQRITCDEEERQRFGYKLVTSYRFPEIGGRLDRKDAEVFRDDVRVMRVSYGDATDLYRINLGWAHQGAKQPPGFSLDLERGYWARNQQDEQDADDAATQARLQRVVPYVKDTKNALVMRFDPPRSGPEMAGLQAAFKEAIQKQFQLEPRELACEPMPSPQDRREILFYEASEGGAGVLRQIAEDPKVLPLLARRALEICHFDPETLEDQAALSCGKACYQCLLDYGNQPDHKDLDRHLIRQFLADLSRSTCRPAGGVGGRAERLAALRMRCDSQLEKRWLDLVDTLQLRLPSDAQYLIESCSTRPDFYYAEHHAAIYVDGPPHDEPAQIRQDEVINQRLMETGYIVIRFHHKDNWSEILGRHPDIFGNPQA